MKIIITILLVLTTVACAAQNNAVNLKYFKVATTSYGTVINWQTIEETNTEIFLIERSTDSRNWQTILITAPHGIGSYIATDRTKPQLPTVYYRLRENKTNYAYTYSLIVRVTGRALATIKDVVYNMQGQRVRTTGAHGVYIINGIKILQ